MQSLNIMSLSARVNYAVLGTTSYKGKGLGYGSTTLTSTCVHSHTQEIFETKHGPL